MTTTPRPAGPVLPTVKPLVRRSTLVRKRDEIENGSSPAPPKRAKVAFDEKVEVQNIHDWEKAPEVILEEVRRALQKHAQGEDSGYDELKSIFDSQQKEKKPVSSITMKSYTMALLSNVSNLNKPCSDLVHAVLNSQWLGRDDDYVRAYMRLMANIVSSQGMFVVEVLGMLVENLTGGKRFFQDPNDRCTANYKYRSSIQW
jgi:RNA polymerase I-specific transcription initiation factor RRN3